MFVVLICTTLWGLFWFQFCLSTCFDIPAFYTFGEGKWYPPRIDYYLENTGPFPWSLAGTFVFLSFLAASLGLFGSWFWTYGVTGKWRIRFATLIFSTILRGFSLAGLIS